MNSLAFNLLLEIGLLALLGLLYYFYQKKKLSTFEKNRPFIIVGQILQSCLIARGDVSHPVLDPIIEEMDDFLHHKAPQAPITALKKYAESEDCEEDLRLIILEGLKELEA